MQRVSGILVHPTSFPGLYGIGDLGDGAYKFIDFMHKAKQSLWQILPLGPTGYGDSPYQSFSTFAGNHYLISPDLLLKEGYLTPSDLDSIPVFDSINVDYGPVIDYKMNLYRVAFKRFKTDATPTQIKAYTKFCEDQKSWLDNYTLFVSIKRHFIEERKNEINSPALDVFRQANQKYLTEGQIKDYYYGACWSSWPDDIAKYTEEAITEYQILLAKEIEFHNFLQYEFFRQWTILRNYAHKKNIKIVGDVPIFVALDSSDVWAEPELFQLDKTGNPRAVAGVPPDYFSETGQLWGNPLYDWTAHKKEGYTWWVRRISGLLGMVDIIRIDHFIGFDSYWATPYGNTTAVNGKWIKGPGKSIFTAMLKELGKLPIIAEDLGEITESVIALRDSMRFPGMKVLQFAFSPDGKNPYLPHNFESSNTVVYTGTHDNDTTIGWYNNSASEEEKDYYRRYLNVSGDNVAWDLIRLAWASNAAYAIAPIQDVFSLGTEARMNTPGEPSGNWRFRYTSDMLKSELAEKLAYLTETFNR
ncbi:MAG: 4-alpha-glucanotransferase [Defluviitaleaceae bacterium]|nr:4-alpha-glucanotransferase [Defluviitaleaceae bacterium]